MDEAQRHDGADPPEQDETAPPSSDPELSLEERQAQDLAALAPPPKWQRTVTLLVMVLTTAVCVLGAWMLRGEASYALGDQVPVDLGPLQHAKLGAPLLNRYVRATAHLEPKPQLRYRRFADADRYQLAPVAGVANVWVEHRVPTRHAGPRYLPPSRLAGRLVRAQDLGARYRGVAAALLRAKGSASTGDTWLLLDGVDPHAARWSLVVALVLLLFAAWNVYGVARLARRVRTP